MDTQTFRKLCPACKLYNKSDAVNCQHCGAVLVDDSAEAVTTQHIDDPFELTDEIREEVTRTYTPPSRSLSLFLLNMGEPIAVCTEDEFVLGRVDEPTSESIVDLTKFDGFAMGVSRRHALIQAAGEKYMLSDLNSSNGTWLNGHRLLPTRLYVLPTGAVIQLGRMKLVISYLNPPENTRQPQP